MTRPVYKNRFVDRQLSTFTPNRTKPRLRWYEFKEGFSGDLVEEALVSTRRNSEGITALDPFAGSGTTLVTAARLGHKATGIEVNPFLAFTAAAKCFSGSWSKTSYQETLRRLCDEGPQEKPSTLEEFSTFSERSGLSKWLFNRSVLRGFSAIDSKLTRRHPAYSPVRLALLAATMDHCNARRDGKCLRYKKNWRETGHTSTELRLALKSRLATVYEDIDDQVFPVRATRVLRGDARRVLRRLKDASHDVMVTSPPYLNSFDYSDVYRPEMFLGGFVRDNDELRHVRLRTVRSHVQASWERPREVVSDMLRPVLRKLQRADSLWDRRLPLMVQAYFEDMRCVLREAFRVVRRAGQAWIVVSTSAYNGIEIPVDLVIADVAVREGWRLSAINVLRSLRAAGQHWEYLEQGAKPPLRESLIILERP